MNYELPGANVSDRLDLRRVNFCSRCLAMAHASSMAEIQFALPFRVRVDFPLSYLMPTS